MYNVSEAKLDTLLLEATNILDKLSQRQVPDTITKSHFGMAVLDIQTEVRNQQTTQFNGLFQERLQA